MPKIKLKREKNRFHDLRLRVNLTDLYNERLDQSLSYPRLIADIPDHACSLRFKDDMVRSPELYQDIELKQHHLLDIKKAISGAAVAVLGYVPTDTKILSALDSRSAFFLSPDVTLSVYCTKVVIIHRGPSDDPPFMPLVFSVHVHGPDRVVEMTSKLGSKGAIVCQ